MVSISIHPRRDLDSSIEPRYFSLCELCYTRCLETNRPSTFTQVANLRALADFLDMVRDELGYPIVVNSGFRTSVVNRCVGGVPRSLHLQGRAADINSIGHFDELVEILRKHRTELSEFIVNKDKNYIHIAI